MRFPITSGRRLQTLDLAAGARCLVAPRRNHLAARVGKKMITPEAVGKKMIKNCQKKKQHPGFPRGHPP